MQASTLYLFKSPKSIAITCASSTNDMTTEVEGSVSDAC